MIVFIIAIKLIKVKIFSLYLAKENLYHIFVPQIITQLYFNKKHIDFYFIVLKNRLLC